MVSLQLSCCQFWSLHIVRLSKILTYFLFVSWSESECRDVWVKHCRCQNIFDREQWLKNKGGISKKTFRDLEAVDVNLSACVCAIMYAGICVNSWLCRLYCKWEHSEFNWTERWCIKPLGQADWKSRRRIWFFNTTLINLTILKDQHSPVSPSLLSNQNISSLHFF